MFHLGRDDVPLCRVRLQRRGDGGPSADGLLSVAQDGKLMVVRLSSAGPRPNAVRPYGLPHSVVRYGIMVSRDEATTYLHRGWNRSALARSKDLVHWVPAGLGD